VFNYAPQLWRLGYTDQYWAFANSEGTEVAAKFVSAARELIIGPGAELFRIRLNLEVSDEIMKPETFESPPASIARQPGRWDDLRHPVLYVADHIELCVHECRATIADEIVVATLTVQRPMRLLDLQGGFDVECSTPFDDLNVFTDFMSRSRSKDWLRICRQVANAAREAGYDGIRYASYFAQAKAPSDAINLAIFGRPLIDHRLKLTSLNRLAFRDIAYRFDFGPTLYRSTDDRRSGKKSNDSTVPQRWLSNLSVTRYTKWIAAIILKEWSRWHSKP